MAISIHRQSKVLRIDVAFFITLAVFSFLSILSATNAKADENSGLSTLNFNPYFSAIAGTNKAFELTYWGSGATTVAASITKKTTLRDDEGLLGEDIENFGTSFSLNNAGIAGDFISGDDEFGLIVPVKYQTTDWSGLTLYQHVDALGNSVDTFANFFINGAPNDTASDHFMGNNLLPAQVSIFNDNSINPRLQWAPVTDASTYMVLVWDDTKSFKDSNGFFDISGRVQDIPISPANFDGVNYSVNLASLGGGDYQFAVVALGNGDEFKDGMSIAGNTVSVTPEPISSMLFLLGSGVLGINVLRRKKKI